MAFFKFIAIDSTGKTIENTVEQQNRTAVIDALTKQNLRPVSIKEVAAKSEKLQFSLHGREKKVKTDQLVLFTRQLSAMIGAGVPLMRALTALESNQPVKAPLKKVLGGIIEDVEGGLPLADAMTKYPKVFNDTYVNMIRAGEAAGILDDILDRLAIRQEHSMATRKKVKGALAYPIVLLTITFIAFFGLMIFIVPMIGNIVKDLGGPDAELPTITLIMLGISDFIVNYWYFIIAGIILLVFLFLSYIRTKRGRYNWHKLLLKLPVVKTLVTKVAVANFARTFSALSEAGVAVLGAIDVTSRAVGNAVFEEALQNAGVEVKNGKTLSSLIAANPIFPPIVSQMLAVGEETGQTGKVLVKVADFYEEEVDTSINSLSSIIEPAMIVVMGVMVGLIAASVMLPIATLSQNVK